MAGESAVEDSTGPGESLGSDDLGLTQVKAKATPTATLDAIAAGLISEKPEVQPHAIAQAEAEAAANVGKDAKGNVFNPAIHAVNADGSPRKTVGGAYALKRGKKSANAATGAAGTTSANPAHSKGIVVPGTAAGMSAKEQASRTGGAQAANLFLMCAVAIGGDEWHPRKDDKIGLDEKVMLETVFGDYFAAKQWEDLPPGLALIAAVGMFSMQRFAMPKTQTRLQKLRGWMGAKIGRWKANRAAKKRGVVESDVERADRDSREWKANNTPQAA